MFECPFPIQRYPHITMAHGGGGALSHELIEKLIKPILSRELESSLDSVDLRFDTSMVPVMTTDSFVVQPLFFPDCDIGRLAVIGATNDLLMRGASPKFLSCSLILEEGFEISALQNILLSLRQTANQVHAKIVCGDTKVVERGKGDGLFINITAIGERMPSVMWHPSKIKVGDSIFVSGDLGRHAVSVMIARGKIPFASTIKSDCESFLEVIQASIQSEIRVRFMKDLTRGGLASNLIESMSATALSAEIWETAVPVEEEVLAFAEVLGLDPLHFACEGRFVLFADPADDQRTLKLLKQFHPQASKVGIVEASSLPGVNTAPLWLKNSLGMRRMLDPYRGELLPRIC